MLIDQTLIKVLNVLDLQQHFQTNSIEEHLQMIQPGFPNLSGVELVSNPRSKYDFFENKFLLTMIID